MLRRVTIDDLLTTYVYVHVYYVCRIKSVNKKNVERSNELITHFFKRNFHYTIDFS